MTNFDYRGTAAAGTLVSGTQAGGSAAALAKSFYDEGWQHAEITVDGRTVGAVTRDLNGHRTWWGEKAGAQPKPVKPVRRRARGFHTGEIRS